MKKEVLLTYGITSNYVDKLANVLVGLKRHSKKFWDDIVVFHDGISPEMQNNINKILPCNFVLLKDNSFIKEINSEAMQLYSIAAFYRYECFNYLKSYKTVIWSDVDVLYQKDLSGILKYIKNNDIAAVTALDEYKVINNLYEFCPDYDMFVPMHNSGLLLFSDSLLKYGDLASYCYKKTIQYAKILRWPDQAIINFMIQDFNLKVGEIPIDIYHLHPSFIKKADKACIVHAHGTKKFWNDEEYNKVYKEWNENERIWATLSNKPLVSVVMSVYDRIEFVDSAIESILNQTYQNFELIIVVEYSDSQSEFKKVFSKYKDDRIRFIYNSAKLGFSKSLNVGIENSKGQFIARMDDDDISKFNRLELEIEFLIKNQEYGLICSNAKNFMYSDNTWFSCAIDNEQIKSDLLVGCPICHPSVMMRKNILEKYKVKYDSNFFSEDYEMWSQLIKFTKFYRLNDILVYYRVSNKSLTSACQNNEEKIAASSIATIKHQLKDNLNLDFGNNEILLIQARRDITQDTPCKSSVLEYKKSVINKILKANEKKKYYNDVCLKKSLGVYYKFDEENNSILIRVKNIIKKVIKKVFYPFYYVLKRSYNKLNYQSKTEIINLVNENNNKLNYISDSINKIEKVNKNYNEVCNDGKDTIFISSDVFEEPLNYDIIFDLIKNILENRECKKVELVNFDITKEQKEPIEKITKLRELINVDIVTISNIDDCLPLIEESFLIISNMKILSILCKHLNIKFLSFNKFENNIVLTKNIVYNCNIVCKMFKNNE